MHRLPYVLTALAVSLAVLATGAPIAAAQRAAGTPATSAKSAPPAAIAKGAVPAGAVPKGMEKITTVEGVTEYRLANGLKVLLIPDESIDTITVNITYLVGSRHEGYGESGMAHLLEHLLFRGTPRRPNPKGDFVKYGARWNGTTSFDRTNYFETLAASTANLDWALDLESDRMLNSFVSRKDLDAEMTVVRNEFESGENNPSSVLRQRVAATAFLWHNYGRAIIGARSDIENVSIDRLQAFYRHYYQPDNAVLIIAGKFEEATALALVQRRFGKLPKPTRTLRPTYTVEPTQDGERAVTLRRSGDVQLVSAMYHLPPGTHADYAAVDILVALLSHTPSGRLHRALVQSGRASSAFGSELQQREAGYAYFGASVRQESSLDAARDALLDTLEGFAKSPVTEDEVERARMRLLNDVEMSVAKSDSLGRILSDTAAMGDWRMLFLHRDRLRQVSAADVQRVATHYLKPANRTLGMFLPTANADRAEIPPVPDVAAMLKDYRGSAVTAQGEAFDPAPASIEARLIRRTLPGGLKLVLLPKQTRGATVVAQLNLRWGDEASKAGRSVACGMAGSMLMRGTRLKSREEIRNAFDQLKASVGVGNEGGSIETVRDSLPDTLRLVAEVLRQPAFPEAEFEQLRTAALTGVEASRSDPSARASVQLSRHLSPYAPEHWFYSATPEERIERLKRVTLDEVRRCHADLVGASDAEMAVVGAFDPEQVAKLAAELFDDWKSPRRYTRIGSRYEAIPAMDSVIETPDKANAVYRAGMNLRMRDDHPDYPALILGNYLLGGASDARLTQRIREREGLSYSVGSFLSIGSLDDKGQFGVSAIYAPENRAKLEQSVREEIARALGDGFTGEEVQKGREGMLKARRLVRTRDGSLAARLNSYLYLGRTLAWDEEFERRIAALKPADILQAMRRHIDLSNLSIVKAGDFAAAAKRPVAQKPGSQASKE
ncbi:MAG: insulinase family protein [Betaproteobacteria bacterium]|nr:insulinase family protein [Betaproteobacteria bacterium]